MRGKIDLKIEVGDIIILPARKCKQKLLMYKGFWSSIFPRSIHISIQKSGEDKPRRRELFG